MNEQRFGIHVSGLVQGVGFRPFIHLLAIQHELTGIVRNILGGVWIEAQGASPHLLEFISQMRDHAPPGARLDRVAVSSLPLAPDQGFRIEPSEFRSSIVPSKGSSNDDFQGGVAVTSVPKDLAPCSLCIKEMRDPDDRRYRYPFITCNICGPRFTIAERLPFDRQHTAMADFPMCSSCVIEFTSLQNRRYHAQTISCPSCGPKLMWKSPESYLEGDQAIRSAVQALRREGVIALKGVGGFQLLCLASASAAVEHIRTIKVRPMKPLAVMAPNIETVREVCRVDHTTEALLTSAKAPIVLLDRLNSGSRPLISPYVAPLTNTLGVMLPSSPLHQLLLDEIGEWLVVTSANRSGAPTDITEEAVLSSIGHMIDGILTHNRAIIHLADDSVLRVSHNHLEPANGRPETIILRHGRGLAPTEVLDHHQKTGNFLALGAHGKASFAFRIGQKVVVSPYIGDWEHENTPLVFEREIATLTTLYGMTYDDSISPMNLVCDTHPAYASTTFAHLRDDHPKKILHHAAHLESIIKESAFSGRGLGVVWDGTGLGEDGTIWGGEFFAVEGGERRRIASIRPIPLWGGEKAIREPRRIALGLLWDTWRNEVGSISYWNAVTTEKEKAYLPTAFAMQSGVVSASSIGRLFDGVAALFHLESPSYFEAQTAMSLEELAQAGGNASSLAISWDEDDAGILRWDWRPLVREANKCRSKDDQALFAATFHHTLARLVIDLAKKYGFQTVLLTGGVFQNALLNRMITLQCKNNDMNCIKHQLMSPGDSGITLGQIAMAEQYA